MIDEKKLIESFCASLNTGRETFPIDLIVECIEEQPKVDCSNIYDDVCEWRYNEDECYFESSCGHLHIFMSDGPKENEYSYCPYCGKKIKVVGI